MNNSKPEKIPVISQLAVIASILLLIFGVGYGRDFLATQRDLSKIAVNDLEAREMQASAASVDQVNDPFSDIVLQGTSAFVWDVKTQKVLYQKEPDQKLPLASVTKLMTALVASEVLAPTETVTISAEAVAQNGESGLSVGERFTAANLTDLMLISSSNDGAVALAEAAGAQLATNGDAATFIKAMNIRANELNLSQTSFRNPTGLDVSSEAAGAYGSARDIAFLLQYIIQNKPDLLEGTTAATATVRNTAGAAHTLKNTNATVDTYAGLLGSKTGYTDLAGGNLAIAFDAALDRPVIVVVLGSSFSGRFRDVQALTTAARGAL